MDVVGIDLGTTSARVAISGDRGTELLSVDGSSTNLAAFVSVDGDAAMVGQKAVRRAVTHPKRTVRRPKMLLGRVPTDSVVKQRSESWSCQLNDEPKMVLDLDGQERTVEQLVAAIFDHLMEQARLHIGGEPSKVVIAVPDWFGDAQRAGLAGAATLSGITSPEYISEALAASLGMRLEADNRRRVALVDIGAFTTTVALVAAGAHAPPQLMAVSSGTTGGEDVDKSLVKQALKQLGVAANDPGTYELVRQTCEEMKIELSSMESSWRRLEHVFPSAESNRISFNRIVLARAVEPLVLGLKTRCSWACRDARIKPNIVDDVYLIGGLSQNPIIIKSVTRIFGKPPKRSPFQSGSIATGAAIHGRSLVEQEVLRESREHKVAILPPPPAEEIEQPLEAPLGPLDETETPETDHDERRLLSTHPSEAPSSEPPSALPPAESSVDSKAFDDDNSAPLDALSILSQALDEPEESPLPAGVESLRPDDEESLAPPYSEPPEPAYSEPPEVASSPEPAYSEPPEPAESPGPEEMSPETQRESIEPPEESAESSEAPPPAREPSSSAPVERQVRKRRPHFTSHASVLPGRITRSPLPDTIESGELKNPRSVQELYAMPMSGPFGAEDLEEIATPILLLRVVARPTVNGILQVTMDGSGPVRVPVNQGRVQPSDLDRRLLIKAILHRTGRYSFEPLEPPEGEEPPQPIIPYVTVLPIVTESLRTWIGKEGAPDELHEALGDRLFLSPVMTPQRRKALSHLHLTAKEQRFTNKVFDGTWTGEDVVNKAGGTNVALQLLTILVLFDLLDWVEVEVSVDTSLLDDLLARAQRVESQTYYEVLQLHWSSPLSEIEDGYQKMLARTSETGDWHELSPEACQKIKKRIEDAYEVLSDEDERMKYLVESYGNVDHKAYANVLKQRAQAAAMRENKEEYDATVAKLKEVRKIGTVLASKRRSTIQF